MKVIRSDFHHLSVIIRCWNEDIGCLAKTKLTALRAADPLSLGKSRLSQATGKTDSQSKQTN